MFIAPRFRFGSSLSERPRASLWPGDNTPEQICLARACESSFRACQTADGPIDWPAGSGPWPLAVRAMATSHRARSPAPLFVSVRFCCCFKPPNSDKLVSRGARGSYRGAQSLWAAGACASSSLAVAAAASVSVSVSHASPIGQCVTSINHATT